ncbi:MAG: L-aspartate oxidase [Verrucomicrobia bacterium]|nr:MAG: L-aspartate oxidase [Verrucomicrobiota bacterium]
MPLDFDVLVVGSGVAGLSLALKAAAAGRRTAILTKKTRAESNTNYAQGGIACVTSSADDFESHVRDTLVAGDGLCREDVVRSIVRDAPVRIDELIELGLRFSRDADGRYALGREGGHSERRILHVKDMTGKAIEDALLHAVAENPRIELMEHLFAIDLITSGKFALDGGPNRVVGLYALDVISRRVETFRAPAVVLSTGGAGQVYLYTTNPDIATGDGIAMAYRVGVEVENMEFVQFHPTTLYSTRHDRFLISEAVRGEGAVLRNLKGEAFMPRYHPDADLAPRDVVARAIDSEMKMTGAPHMWLDITGRSESMLRDRFPLIFEHCLSLGLNLSTDQIPVVPAAHYTCGGVVTNLRAETSLPGLFACGEVASTGLHGANRLASNSLLEAVVMAEQGARAIENYLTGADGARLDLPEWISGNVDDSDEQVVIAHNWDELRRTMWDYVGIVRTTKRLERAQTRIGNLNREIHDYYWNFRIEPRLLELRNLIQIADLIVQCALARKESRGLHYTLDFPGNQGVPEDSRITLEPVPGKGFGGL